MSKAFRPLLRHGARRGLPTKAGFSRGPTAVGHSRRDVLRFGAQGLAAAALLAPTLGQLTGCAQRSGNGSARSNQNGRDERAPTVIVVGAGFAGLACADTLAHGGANVIVLEATSRPGGRVRTDRAFIAGDNVELGGEWIGRNHPAWLAFAQEFSLRLEEPGEAPSPAPTTDEAPATDDAPPTLPPEPGERPGQSPDGTPADPDPTAPDPLDAGTGVDKQSSSGSGLVVPRPRPFETEMDIAPAGPQGANDRAAERSHMRLAMFAQPANEQDAPDDTPEAPTEAPADAPADPPADAPPSDQPADAEPPAAQPPATQPATTAASGEPEEPIILNGKLIRGEAADQLFKEVDEVVAALIELARDVDPVRPWTHPSAADLDARSFAAYIDEQKGLGDNARALLLSSAEADNGVVPERMSLLGYLAMIAGGGLQSYFDDSETYRLADGNDALATALAQKLGDRVRFNSAVDLVRREPDRVVVRTRTGDVFHGDAVVIATPPSVWDRIQFLPAITESLQPQMGQNVKLIVALREPVWEKHNLTAEAVSDGLVGMTWAATDPESRGPVALTLFSGGHQAEALRRVDPDRRNASAFQSLSPAYPDVPAAHIKSRFVDWPGMPMTLGSYSFPAPGQVTAFGPVLVDGLAGDGRAPLMFAGEHTAYGFIGYMEGALSSGVRVARTLLGEPTPLPATTQPDTVPADEAPAETPPADAAPTDAAPSEAAPADAPPADNTPREPAPSDAEPEPEHAPEDVNKDCVPV